MEVVGSVFIVVCEDDPYASAQPIQAVCKDRASAEAFIKQQDAAHPASDYSIEERDVMVATATENLE